MALSKEKQKLVDRLRMPRLRAREGAFLVEGIRGSQEFLRATLSLKIRFALVSSRLDELQGGVSLRAGLVDSGIPMEDLPDQELRDLSATENPQGVILVVDEPDAQASAWEEIPSPRLLILDGIQDPGNVGTLIRGARGFGLDGVIALDGTADPWSPKAVRAGAGAMAHTPVVRVDWKGALGWIQGWKVPILVSEAEGEDIRGVRINGGWALVVGNEGAGVRPEIREEARRLLAIPMAAGVDSLNVAAAGAILLYALGGNSADRGED